MAVETTSNVVALGTPPAGAPPRLAARASLGDRYELGARVSRQLAICLPIINLISIAITFVFLEYVLPMPGGAAASSTRWSDPIIVVGLTAAGWIVCDLWARQALRPVRRWLESGKEPDEFQRLRAIRFPMAEAIRTGVVWMAAALVFAAIGAAEGWSATACALLAIVVALGGGGAIAMSYFSAERIMRPITALAMEQDPPACPLVPGIGARIYLAWEFGTAVAVAGAVVVAVAYLAGADISARRMAITVIFLSGVALTVGLVTLLAAIRSVSDPVRGVRSALARLEAGDTDVTVPVDDGGEIGLLQAGFNRMVAGLRERDRVRELFGRHVGEEVARSALARGIELGGEVRDAAVLFTDVVGSTSLAACSDPREVVATLNHFFGIVVEVVTLHGGWVNKFEGDAALCVFGAPSEHPNAAGAALAAARELRRRLATELDGVNAAIGLSAGEVVAGNIGAAHRYEYTVIGDPVNEAARLTELAKASAERLLASDAIIARAGKIEAGRWQLGEQVVLRGRPAPTRVATPA